MHVSKHALLITGLLSLRLLLTVRPIHLERIHLESNALTSFKGLNNTNEQHLRAYTFMFRHLCSTTTAGKHATLPWILLLGGVDPSNWPSPNLELFLFRMGAEYCRLYTFSFSAWNMRKTKEKNNTQCTT